MNISSLALNKNWYWPQSHQLLKARWIILHHCHYNSCLDQQAQSQDTILGASPIIVLLFTKHMFNSNWRCFSSEALHKSSGTVPKCLRGFGWYDHVLRACLDEAHPKDLNPRQLNFFFFFHKGLVFLDVIFWINQDQSFRTAKEGQDIFFFFFLFNPKDFWLHSYFWR